MNNPIKKKRIFLNYVIVYFAIAFSGIPFFDENKLARVVFLVFLLLLYIPKRKRIEFRLILLVIGFFLVELFQILIWGGRYFSILTSLPLLIILPYILLKLLGKEFSDYYITIIYAFSIISLVFWIATNIVPGFHEFTYNLADILKPFTPHEYTESFILYTYEESQELGLYRNPGPFHEPGAFGVFLVLAIVLNYIKTKRAFDRRNIIFFITILTTFSTAAYLSISIFILLMNIFLLRKLRILSLLLFPLILFFIYSSYKNLDFMEEKISEQYEYQIDASLTTPTSGRILGARKALISIYKHPLTGRGLIAQSKAELTSEDAAGYGWITWISNIGIILGVIYMFYFYRSLKEYCKFNYVDKRFAFIAFFSLLIVLAGQKHFSSIIFFMIFLFSYLQSSKIVNV